jgi:ribosomal protein S18 acetylase RimI-like enzyme
MIERATADEFAAIADLNVRAYAEFSSALAPGTWELMRQNLTNIAERSRVSQFLVVRGDQQVIGSVAYSPAGSDDPALFMADMASVLLLAVDPEHRGQGIAKALIAACISSARRDGAVCIGLFTNELMQPAQHLYRSLGFRLESELHRRYGVRYFRYVLSLK